MDLRQFKYFLRIAELGSLSRAAESLHVAQSALSRHVSNMEAEFGQALLLRNGRGVSVTSAGEELVRYARAMLRLSEEAKAALAQTARSPSGTIAVGLPLSLTQAMCIPLIGKVRVRYPNLALQLYDEISGAVADHLRSGRLQVAMLFEDAGLDGLRWQPVFEEELFLVVRVDHPLANETTITLKTLATVPVAIPSNPLGVRPIVEEVLTAAGHTLTVLVEANSLTVMKQVARLGLGGAVMSACSVVDELAMGEVVLLPIEGRPLVRRAAVALSPVQPQWSATELVFDLLVSIARDEADSDRWRGCRLLQD